MRSQMEEAKRKIAELDAKIVQLKQIIDRAKKVPISAKQEVSNHGQVTPGVYFIKLILRCFLIIHKYQS